MTLKGRELRVLVLDDVPGNDPPAQLPMPLPEQPASGIDRLDRALGIIFEVEGGYSNHPRDNGGPTNHGITQATLSAWRGRPVSVQEVQKLTTAEAVEIYRERFWKTVEAHKLPAGIDVAVFDQSVNSGPKTAQILL
jgi:lysozyme family protein